MDNLSIVIPFYNGQRTVAELINTLPIEIPILIIDDLSDEPLTQARIDATYSPADGSKIRVIRLDRKGYFAGAVNRGLQESQTDVLVLNQDVWFDSHAFFDHLETLRADYAFFGERIRGDHPAFGNLGYVHGTCMFIRRDAIREVGLLNEKDYPLWGNTAEYQWRVARKNFKILPIPEIPGFHHERPAGERYGTSIKNLLDQTPTSQKGKLIRTPPLISVVVPCFNYGRYLHDCIASLIGGFTSLGEMPGQTLQSMEIVIVDDASTDNSMEHIKLVTDISKGIRAYHLDKNVGTARALNFGIERCFGKYITFLSADDMREPDSLEKLVEVCEQNPHSFAYDDIWLFNKHERMKKWRMEEYDFETLIWKNHVHAGIVFPRAAWVEVGGYPAVMNDGREDWAFNVALGVKGWCGVHLRNYGYLYRREGQNRTETNSTDTHRERFLAKIMGLFPDIYRGKRPMTCCGKGTNTRSNSAMTSRVSLVRGATIAENTLAPSTSGPMERIEYLGNQMSFTISGDVTNTKYTFGKDRPIGWVFKDDVGTRDGKLGFLSKRENGKYLYQLAGTVEESAPQPEPVVTDVTTDTITNVTTDVTTEEAPTTVLDAPVEMLMAGETAGSATAEPVGDVPDPTDLTVEQIKALADQNLTKAQWEEIYKIELAGRNRKGATTFIEEMLASLP